MDGADTLRAGDTVTTSSHITAVRIQDAGKAVEVLAVITKDGRPVMEVISSFLYAENTLTLKQHSKRKVEAPMEVQLSSRKRCHYPEIKHLVPFYQA